MIVIKVTQEEQQQEVKAIQIKTNKSLRKHKNHPGYLKILKSHHHKQKKHLVKQCSLENLKSKMNYLKILRKKTYIMNH